MKRISLKLMSLVIVTLGFASQAGGISCATDCSKFCEPVGTVGTPICMAECIPARAAACVVSPNSGKALFTVRVANDCNLRIQVAAHYLNNNKQWVTDGWWPLGPGDQSIIFATSNRVVYLYAESVPKRDTTWAGDHYWTVRGRSVGFMKKEIVKNGGTWTERFTCK